MNATNTNRSNGGPLHPGRCVAAPSSGRATAVSSRAPDLGDAILAEFHGYGIEATRDYAPAGGCRWWPGDRSPAPPRPITVTGSGGPEAIVVVLENTSLEFLFGPADGGRAGLSLLRAARVRSFETRLCEDATAAAMAVEARRLLIVCDTTRTRPAVRPRTIRWVREVAHRIGYESSINGLQDLATSYLVLAATTETADAARSVRDWYRSAEAR